MPRNYPGSKDVWPAASFYLGKSFSTAGGRTWPEDVGDQFEALQDWIGYAFDPVSGSSMVSRLRAMEGAVNVATRQAGIVGDGVTNCSTALQDLLNGVGSFGGGIVYLPPGDYVIANPIVVLFSNVRLIGAGRGATRLLWTGGASTAFTWLGSDLDFNDRLFNCGIEDLSFVNNGTAGALALRPFACTHHLYRNLEFSGFRGGAIHGSNFADSVFDFVDYEYCGSADDSDIAVIRLDPTGSTAWAADRIHFNYNRIEACSDRAIDFRDGSGLSVNKVLFTGLKIENMQTGSDGMGGNLFTGAQIYLQGCGGITFVAPDFTFGGRRNGTHGSVPALMKLAGWSEVHLVGSSGININPPGGSWKPFLRLFDIDDGHSRLDLGYLGLGIANAADNPDEVILAAGTPELGGGVYFKGWSDTPTPTLVSGAYTSMALL